MAKFNPCDWTEIKNGEDNVAPKGLLQLRLSQEAALYVSQHGFEALAGIDTEFKLTFAQAEGEEISFRVEGPEGTRIFMFAPVVQTFSPSGEVFTNADRMPMESGSVAAVTRALRMMKLEQRNLMAEIRAERDQLDRLKDDTDVEEEEDVVEDDAEAESEDEPADQGDAK